MTLEGRVAVVTGARAGIGRATAEALLREGARTLLVGQSEGILETAHALAEIGPDTGGFVADLRDPAVVDALAEHCRERFGTVDILVNNAGVSGIGSIDSISLEMWDRVLASNVTSAFLASRAFLPGMKEQRSGAIVNVASVAGRSFSQVAGVHYTASKAALIGFTRQLARETAPWGVRVNAVAPSQTDTEMLRDGLERAGKGIEVIEATVPLGRIARPEEIASACLFLCQRASSYITGAVLDVNGGQLCI